MKKILFFILIIIAILLLSSSNISGQDKEDLKFIKRAVSSQKESLDTKKFEEAKWLKIEVFDKIARKTRVKIIMPISVLEIIFNSNIHPKVKCDEKEIDFQKLFKELKSLGRMELIEIDEEDESVKIWLE
ncbi:MAG: hypothetical protein AB1410_01220 [Acidobacteriota bacterium]